MKRSQGLPRRSLVYFLICAAGVVGMLLLAIYPQQRALRAADGRIGELKAALAEQTMLTPLFEKLLEARVRIPAPPLPVPDRQVVSLVEVESIAENLESLARDSGLSVQSVTTDSRNIGEGKGDQLPMTFELTGPFASLRAFLVKVGGYGYVDRLESVRIQSGGKIKVFEVKLLLGIKK